MISRRENVRTQQSKRIKKAIKDW